MIERGYIMAERRPDLPLFVVPGDEESEGVIALMEREGVGVRVFEVGPDHLRPRQAPLLITATGAFTGLRTIERALKREKLSPKMA